MTGPRFVVTVGTDHHPFSRLIGWVNDWLGEHPQRADMFFVQFGPSEIEPACPRARFLEAGRLDDVLDDADVMICHGGPGSIADAWRRGQKPIAVPRLRRFGEVVDDHQVDFCRKLDGLGSIRLAEDAGTLAALIDEAIRDRSGFRTAGPAGHNGGSPHGANGSVALGAVPGQSGEDSDQAVTRFAELVDELVSRPPRRSLMTYRTRRPRRGPAADPGTSAVAGDQPPGPIPAAASNSQPGWEPADAGLAGIALEEPQ